MSPDENAATDLIIEQKPVETIPVIIFVTDTVCMDVSDRNAPLSLLRGPDIHLGVWVSGTTVSREFSPQ